jgi:Spy/CpxP family protein refolding chaperone
MAATGAAPAWAQGGGFGGSEHGDHHQKIKAIFAQLNLTADQKQQLKQIHQQTRTSMSSLVKQHHDARKQFMAALASTASDNDLRTMQQQLVQQREAIASARLEGLLQVRQVLTPEQRQQFAALYQAK